MPRRNRADIARRRWISTVVDYTLGCRTGALAERIERGMQWVDSGVERCDTGIGIATRRRVRADWAAVAAEAEQHVREIYVERGAAWHNGRRCSCAGCYARERGVEVRTGPIFDWVDREAVRGSAEDGDLTAEEAASLLRIPS